MESHDTEPADVSFDVNHPNRSYRLDLRDAGDVTIAKQLVSLAREQGSRTWRKAKLNGRPLHVSSLASKSWSCAMSWVWDGVSDEVVVSVRSSRRKTGLYLMKDYSHFNLFQRNDRLKKMLL